jgi:hypothetical protein
MLPCTRFCICFLDFDYVLHIVNFAILYYETNHCSIYTPSLYRYHHSSKKIKIYLRAIMNVRFEEIGTVVWEMWQIMQKADYDC